MIEIHFSQHYPRFAELRRQLDALELSCGPVAPSWSRQISSGDQPLSFFDTHVPSRVHQLIVDSVDGVAPFGVETALTESGAEINMDIALRLAGGVKLVFSIGLLHKDGP